MKTDKQFIDEIYKKYDEYQKEEKIKRQKVMKRIINIAAAFVGICKLFLLSLL